MAAADIQGPGHAPFEVEDRAARSRRLAAQAFEDLAEGLRRRELWGAIGWLDVRQRYRRSLIGPLWITISLGLFIGGIGVVYSALFGQEIRTYLPFLAAGMIAWSLISALLLEGCASFILSEGAIKQLPVPISTHVYRMVWRNLIIFAHNMLIFVVVALIFGVNPGWGVLAVLPGVLALAVNGVGFGLTLGILSARFRDIPVAINNAVQLLLFATPILWSAQSLPTRQWVVQLNPLYYLVEIVRAPLLGGTVEAGAWLAVLAFTIINLALAAFMYARYRWRIAYWL